MSEERAISDIVWTPERGLADPEVRGITWENFALSDEYGGKWRTAADIRVTPESALQSTVVLASCRILAESIASLPIHVYRRTESGGKEKASDIPLYKVLSFAPNTWQTKFEFFEQMVMNLCLWGNSYSQIKSGRYGAVSELINLHPSRMEVERLENGRLLYSYTNPETGRLEKHTQDQIMHVRWTPAPDGIKGMVPIEIGREAIALARACENHAARYWANSARPGVVLQTDGSLSPEAAERLRENWERLHKGSQNAYRTAVLTNGLKAEPIGFTSEQSQFIDSRRFQTEEIARIFRLPLSLIQGTGGGNLEVQGQEFVTYTLLPWLRRIESAISRTLIYNDDVFFAEFDVKGLLRADSNSRAAYYSTMTNLGILSINECRALENLPPLKAGDSHFVAMNMQTLEDATKPKQDPMAAMMGAGSPPPAPGGPPSLPEVKTGAAPIKSPDGIESEKKPEDRSLSPQNQALYDSQEAIVEKNGKWPQTGADGAHYMEQNPFADRGMSCGNCIHFQNPAGCEIVSGEIKADAICKLWIIPEEKIAAEQRAFCATGDGGGLDNSCGPKIMSAPDTGGGSGGGGRSLKKNKDPDPISPKDVPDVKLSRTDDSAAFLAARNKSTRPENFSDVSLERLAKSQKFISADGKTGCLVDEDGDLGNVFNNGGPKNAGMDAVLTAIESGAKTLDCYDNFLPKKYAQVGFVAIAKVKWSDEYAPPNWDYEAEGRPDIVIMRYDGGDRSTVRSRVGSFPKYKPLPDDRYTDDIDAAKRTVREPAKRDSGLLRHAGRLAAGARGRPDGDEGRIARILDSRVAEESGGVHGEPVSESSISLASAASLVVDSLPAIEFRSFGNSIAHYSEEADTIYVSPSLEQNHVDSLSLSAMNGWMSQPNPVLHEYSHRYHMMSNPEGYPASCEVSLTKEQRTLISSEVSRYAATNAKEFIAEYVAGRLSGKTYSDEVKEIVHSVTNGCVRL